MSDPTARRKKPRDSKTLDVKKSIKFTDRITLRIDPETKRLLQKSTKAMGMTQCQLIHCLLTAYFYGLGDRLDLDVKSPTINLTIERQVKRVRRYEREYVGVGEGEELYCALKDVFPGVDRLPLPRCVGCPNVRCREHVLNKSVK